MSNWEFIIFFQVILRNVQLLSEALACTVYELHGEACRGQVFSHSDPSSAKEKRKLGPSADAVAMWTEEMAARPRATATTLGADNPTVQVLTDTLKVYCEDVRQHVMRRDKRDPEFAYYDAHSATMNAYRVKPAVFDLVLTIVISGYLGLVYLMLANSDRVFRAVAALTVVKATSASGSVSDTNGHSNGKVKAH